MLKDAFSADPEATAEELERRRPAPENPDQNG